VSLLNQQGPFTCRMPKNVVNQLGLSVGQVSVYGGELAVTWVQRQTFDLGYHSS